MRFNLKRVRVRFSSIKNVFYVSTSPSCKQEFSCEVDELNEEMIIDFDIKKRIIGFAILNSTKYLPYLTNTFPDHVWIDVPVQNYLYEEPFKPRRLRFKIKNRIPKKHLIPPREDIKINEFTPFLKTKLCRDIEWAINSPTILQSYQDVIKVTDEKFVLENRNDDIIKKLDLDPSPFYEWVVPKYLKARVLGGYFATLVEYWLSTVPSIEKLLTKYQIYDENLKKTICDLDFLFYSIEDEEWFHWEVGVKYFFCSREELILKI